MKTPRQLLFERHRSAEAQLDGIRRETISDMQTSQREATPIPLRQILRSLRWHLAGISAVWIVVFILHMDAGQSSQLTASIPAPKIPAPQVIMASMRENRRQLAEMIGPREPENQRRDLPLPKPRSEAIAEFSIA